MERAGQARISTGLRGVLALAPFLLPAPVLAAAAPDEYQVYRAYLASPLAEKGPVRLFRKLGIFFIYNVDHEKPEHIAGFFRQQAHLDLDPGMVRQFVAVNHHPVPVDPRRLPADWTYSTQYIQQGVYSLSRVGFNAARDQALFYASYNSLLEDGHGSLVCLRRSAGAWTVVKAAAVWIYGASVHPFNP